MKRFPINPVKDARPCLTQRLELQSRAGLAPLELVLALPLLLCVMALIVNFAHAATWKVRTATSARLAMWRHRPMWNADGDPKPLNLFPPTASMGVAGGARISQVDQAWNQTAIQQPWIKGPVFAVQNGYLAVRDNRVNEMSEGVSQGIANVSLRYPFLPSMGNLTMQADNTLLDSVWQFHTMGYDSNEARRAKGWWQLEDSPDWTAQKQRFLRADSRLQGNPLRERLRPLDRDEDLIRRGYIYDFYARQHPVCSNNVQDARDSLILPGGLLDRIRGLKQLGVQGVCERMAGSYLRMYRDELAAIESDPNMAVRVAQLKEWIKQLEDFLAKLP